jgi:hypothetical protein
MCDMQNPAFTDETKAREFLEVSRWPDGTICPFCGQQETVSRLGGKSMGPGWFFCSDCKDKFTIRTGTVMERSHMGGFLHVNTTECRFGLMKRAVFGAHHNVSEAHLHRYLVEWDFKWNRRSSASRSSI